MKKYCSIICLFLLLPLFMISQNNPKLDDHPGFNEIRIGDSKDKWSKELTFKTARDGVSIYELNKNPCCKEILDMDVENIFLYIQSNTIVGIEINTHNIQEGINGPDGKETKTSIGMNKFEEFRVYYNSLFGEQICINLKLDAPAGKPMVAADWKGSEIVFYLNYLNFGKENGDRLQVKIWDVDFLKKGLGF